MDADQETPESAEITLTQVLTTLSFYPERVERFATGDKDAVIDEVLDEIARETTAVAAAGVFPPGKRRLLTTGTLTEIQAEVARETEGAFLTISVCRPVCRPVC